MSTLADRISQPKTSARRSWHRPVRLLALFAFQVTLILVAGTSYQTLASAVDGRNYPAPGRLIDVGGYRLHINVLSEGMEGPTVILENGGAGFSPQWGWVQPGVAQFASVVAYDRPGTGWSEVSPEPLDAAGVAKALRTALEKSDIFGPYVLAGHSMGALMVRTFTSMYPSDVIGIVLVDPRPVSWDAVFPDGSGNMNPTFFRLLSALNRVGIPRLMGTAQSKADGLPPRAYEEAVALSYSNHHVGNMLSDGLVGESAARLLASGDTLGNRPLIVLSAGTADASFDNQARHRFTVAQAEMISLSSRGQHRLVAGATHYIIVTHQQYAQEVVAAIRAVIVSSVTEE